MNSKKSIMSSQTDDNNILNILVLGETGVGKSTFINSLINYLSYDTMQEALNNGVRILIKSSFSLMKMWGDESSFTLLGGHEFRKIIAIPNVQGSEEEIYNRSNENIKSGESATQEPKSYIFNFGDGFKSIRIIDTPGFGDIRGIDRDRKNFEKILSFISGFSEIHAICILLKPNELRLTVAFRFCVDELLVHLHKSAAQNILFCFTNTRGTFYKPLDSLPALEKHLYELEKRCGIRIPLIASTLFFFDNESFRFLCAKREGFSFSSAEKRIFDLSWNKSVEETQRLFKRITELPVYQVNETHQVAETLSPNNTRNVILSLTLAEITKMQAFNMWLIEDKMAEVEKLAEEGKSLQGKLFVEQMKITTVELNEPQTFCTDKACVVEFKRFNSSNEVMQTVYKTICHQDCKLTGVQAEICFNDEIQRCLAMSGNGSPCRNCGHSWNTHMHIRYKLEYSMEKVENNYVKDSIARKESSQDTIKTFLRFEKHKVEEMKAEQKMIMQCCASFASFLQKNSLMNNLYGDYVDHLIKAESGRDKFHEQLQSYKAQYNEEVRILEENMSNASNLHADSLTIEDIEKMVLELQGLKHCGPLIVELEKMELLTLKKSTSEQGVFVPVGSSNGLISKLGNYIKLVGSGRSDRNLEDER